MLKQEWKSLLHNKLLLLVVVAIILIPVIYAGLFLKSMWDPYGSVSNLPVAVVNDDQPVEYEGTTLQIGADMVDELKDNDSMAFNFVDAETSRSRSSKRHLLHGDYHTGGFLKKCFHTDG